MTASEERETIIRFDDGEDGRANVYTASPAYWEKLKELGFEPSKVHRSGGNRITGKEFDIPKGLITIRKPLSKAQIKQRRQAGLKSLFLPKTTAELVLEKDLTQQNHTNHQPTKKGRNPQS